MTVMHIIYHVILSFEYKLNVLPHTTLMHNKAMCNSASNVKLLCVVFSCSHEYLIYILDFG